MPRVFKAEIFETPVSEKVTAYADKHMPVVECENTAARGKKFKVKVRIGNKLAHPNTKEHYFTYVQLWNLETLLAETTYQAGAYGYVPQQVEVDFYIVPRLSMRLTAMAYCTKHGLWQSSEVFVQVADE